MELISPAYAGQQVGHSSRGRKASNADPDRVPKELRQELFGRLPSGEIFFNK